MFNRAVSKLVRIATPALISTSKTKGALSAPIFHHGLLSHYPQARMFSNFGQKPFPIKKKKSADSTINIEGLPKELVLIALFNNVYNKSEFSCRISRNVADLHMFHSLKPPVNMDVTLGEFEARKMLSKGKYIDYIGPVMFKIDFSENTIDARQYDTDHKTGTNHIKTAKECIDELRHSLTLTNNKFKP